MSEEQRVEDEIVQGNEVDTSNEVNMQEILTCIERYIARKNSRVATRDPVLIMFSDGSGYMGPFEDVGSFHGNTAHIRIYDHDHICTFDNLPDLLEKVRAL